MEKHHAFPIYILLLGSVLFNKGKALKGNVHSTVVQDTKMSEVKFLDIKGHQVKVSVEDYDRCILKTWNVSGNTSGRAYFNTKTDKKIILLHHFILGSPDKGFVVDHINGNTLDNTRENLRFATYSQNSQNSRRKKQGDYIGIYYRPAKNHWSVYCNKIYIGRYLSELEAAIAYDKAALIMFGEYARTNGLVEYKNVADLKLDDVITVQKKQSALPKNISVHKDRYRAAIIFEKKTYEAVTKTLEDAIEKLAEFKETIASIKEQRRHAHNQKPITRNEDGIAYFLIKGKPVLVDDDMWHKLQEYVWNINPSGYAKGLVDNVFITMHRFVFGTVSDDHREFVVDHINNNRLDNRCCNLRLVPTYVNSHNRVKNSNTTSKYIGVYKSNKKWASRFNYKGETYYLGTFETEEEAARVYNAKATELYGEYANLNAFISNPK